MPRLLLGVSGGIAAYKALELVRLATDAGYAVRVIQTRGLASASSAPASFAALSGAPVLCGTFERDPLRGSYPGRPAARPRPGRAPRAGRRRRRLPDRPGLGEHDRQARPRARRQPAEHRRARGALPADRRPGDERADVGARRDAGQRRAAARARRRGARARRRPPRDARRVRASAACPSRPRCSPRSHGARRRRALGAGCAR